MRYYLGPWQWIADGNTPHFAPPVGAIGAIDLGSVPEMSTGGAQRKGCLCWTNGTLLSSEYDLLGVGDIREIHRTAKLTATIRKASGATPKGDRLNEMILDCFVDGSDPDGATGPKPIVPGSDGWMDLWMAGHGRVKGERFEWGRSSHTAKIKRQLRAEFSQLMDDAEAGRSKDREHHRRCLDALCEKYGVSEWREFVPTARQKDVPGRLKHETTITESFNKADSSTLGPDLSWTELTGDMAVVLNACELVTNFTPPSTSARADADLSSADNYAQCVAVNAASLSTTSAVGPITRKDSSSTLTWYQADWLKVATPAYRTVKVVSGTGTVIGSNTNGSAANGTTIKVHCNGSTITRYVDWASQNATTDTSISSGLRSGLIIFSNAGTKPRLDSFEASDLVASGLLYTQLERGTRGITRGVYTRNGG